ncbi:MAG TPA: LD-carboxypeptidase [Candidatus Acidoferrales bacterium]|nr:LD-carboxypeptidase [Candidatus Acidoferrales bacterium]
MADAKITRPAKIIRPAGLRPGDKIALVAPASSFSREAFLAGCDRLRQMGFEPVYSQNIFDRDIYFAGTVERRAHEFQEFWRRDDIAALICVRGGYGSNYLVEKLDYGMIAAQPKILLGSSDITSLLTAIHDRTGLIGFHGPMVAKDIAGGTFDEASWRSALQGASNWTVPSSGIEVLRTGKAAGRLYGGCLSIMVASLGTPFEIQTEDTILFIEDIAEKPFRIDRMLMQLQLAGKLDSVRGFVFGEMLDCAPPKGETYTLQQVILRVLAPYNVPIVYGLKSGHVTSGNITLPIGVQAELEAEGAEVQLRIMEAATL